MFIEFLPHMVFRFALMSPLSVPTFCPIRERIHVLWWILQNVRKVGVEEKNPNLGPRISEMAGVIIFKFRMWTPLPSRQFCGNCSVNQIRNHGATKV